MPAKAVIGAVTSWAIDADVSDGTIVATYAPAIPATDKWVIEATRPLSAGKQSRSQDFKIIDVLATADASPVDVTTAYEAIYGAGWKVAGAKIFFRIKPVQMASGQEATKFEASTIVVA
jgi:hypothetical protein